MCSKSNKRLWAPVGTLTKKLGQIHGKPRFGSSSFIRKPRSLIVPNFVAVTVRVVLVLVFL